MSERAQSTGHEWLPNEIMKCCSCGASCHTPTSLMYYAQEECKKWHAAHVASVAQAAQPQEVPAPDYARIIAEDDATLKAMRDKQNPEWRTVIVGLPILRKLLNGEDVTLESFRVNLIPDDVLFSARPK